MARININADAQGNMIADVPDFAMEATLQRIAVDTGLNLVALKTLARGNDLSAKGMKESQRAIQQQLEQQLKVAEESQRQDQIADSKDQQLTKDQIEQQKKTREQQRKDAAAGIKSISSGFQALIAGNNTMAGTIGPAVQGMGKIGESIVEGFNNPFVKAGLGALTKGMTAIGGFALGVADEFAEQARNMTQITGGGLYTNMLELRTSAGEAGLFLKDLTSALEQSSISVGSLSSNVDEGMKAFSGLSKSFAEGTAEYGDFGFTVEQLNGVMLQEIEIMQRMGMSQDQVAKSLQDTNGGLNRMLIEATALANLTGADRRELLRARMAERTDPVGGLRYMNMSDDERNQALNTANVVQAMFGDVIGPELIKIANAADQSNTSVEVMLKRMSPDLLAASQLMIGQGGPGFTEIMNAYLNNDIRSIQGMGQAFQGMGQNEAFIEGMSRLATLSDNANVGGGAGNILQSIMELNQRGTNLFDADIGALELDTTGTSLALNQRRLRELASQIITKVSNTEIGFGDYTFKPGDGQQTSRVVEGVVEMLSGSMGLDGDLSKGMSTTEIGAAVAFMMAKEYASQDREGGGGGFGMDLDMFGFGGGDGKKPSRGKAGKLRTAWNSLFSGLKSAGGYVFGGTAGSLVIRGAGAAIATISASSVAPFVAGAAALALGGYGLYKGYQYMTSDDDDSSTNNNDNSINEVPNNNISDDDIKKNIANTVTAINNIRQTDLGDIMAGVDPAKGTGQLDLLTRIGSINEKGHQQQIELLKLIADDVDASRVVASAHLSVKEKEMREINSRNN
tara:strand:- start:692 stop:3076 length:2385 start_codon:yes stop_codon:yes gene_type:complete